MFLGYSDLARHRSPLNHLMRNLPNRIALFQTRTFRHGRPAVLAAIYSTIAIGSLRADVTLPRIFSDHAVLLKSESVPVWGKGTPGEAVTVTLEKSSAQTVVGDDGKWKTVLNLKDAGPGPYELVVQGKNTLTVRDVLVGEVWFCSGQSNMDFPLGSFPVAKTEVPNSANPNLRQFLVKRMPSADPLDDVEGEWMAASPATAGKFSAVAYFFGKNLQKELAAPVGLINSALGGTMIEAWMSNDALASDPVVKAGAEKAQNDRRAFDHYADLYAAWQKKYGREDRKQGDPAAFAGLDVDTSDWKTVTLPGFLAEAGLPEAGAIWVRRKVPAPSQPDIAPKKFVDMFLDNIQDSNEVYWNGRRVGSSPVDSVVHRYGVKGDLVNDGDNVVALRIFSACESGGVAPGGQRFQGNHVSFKGEWLAKVEYAFPPLDEAAKAEFPKRPATPIDSQNVAGYLYNSMVYPLIPYAVRGVIWYQGEGNWNRGYQYRAEFPAMITDWRAKWGRGDLPFYFCQIANLGGHSRQPEKTSMFAEVREAQSMALTLPNTGQAVLIDLGEEENIHPADKMSVGDRLARIAFAQTYGKDIVYSGPVFDSMTVEGDKARVRFKHAAPGLVARPLPESYAPSSQSSRMVPLVRNSPQSEIEGFAICGEDKKWEWASAKIEGDTVIVWSDAVPKPVAVRYAWAQNPFCNLYNAAGLPANPFRTDDFPLASRNAKY